MEKKFSSFIIKLVKQALKEYREETEESKKEIKELKEEKKQKRVIVLYDYENIDLQPNFKVVDFKKLREKILEIGQIDFAFVFIPQHCIYDVMRKKINDEGFEIIVCQKKSKQETGKLEDTVDIDLIRIGMRFLEYNEITDMVIVSGDEHMIELVKEAHKRNKKVHIYGTEQISSALKDLIEHVDKVPI